MRSVNPATQEEFARYDAHSPEQVDAILQESVDAYASWKKTSFAQRAALMRRAADLLREENERWAQLMTAEMGKTIKSARAEVNKCAWVCDFYADNAERFLTPEVTATDASLSMVRYDPLGPILAVMPWNFPFWQVFRFAAPYLMAGNTGLLKHASNTQGSALAIEEIFTRAGFPAGVFRTLLVSASEVEGVIKDPRVRGVTLTGSEYAGRAVGAAAGAVIKPSVLELGGADPFIVLADADIARAAEQGALGRLINNGQSCIAAKRFIVVDEVHDEFVEHFTAALSRRVLGDPTDEGTDIGPMAREDLRAELHDQVTRSVEAGAELALGGELPEGPGYFYPVTLLLGVEPGMAAFDEETFGPVAPVIRARDTRHAIELANMSDLGLGAALWTADLKEGLALAAEIESGHVALNGITKSDPRLPFGGVKNSGYGRELSRYGILEFVNIKTVWAG